MRSVFTPVIDGWPAKARPIITRNRTIHPQAPVEHFGGLHHMFSGVLFVHPYPGIEQVKTQWCPQTPINSATCRCGCLTGNCNL